MELNDFVAAVRAFGVDLLWYGLLALKQAQAECDTIVEKARMNFLVGTDIPVPA